MLQARLEHILKSALAPAHLEVIDNSYLHYAHNELAANFTVIIEAEKLRGLSRIDSHRLINDLVFNDPELHGKIHALSIQIKRDQS